MANPDTSAPYGCSVDGCANPARGRCAKHDRLFEAIKQGDTGAIRRAVYGTAQLVEAAQLVRDALATSVRNHPDPSSDDCMWKAALRNHLSAGLMDQEATDG